MGITLTLNSEHLDQDSLQDLTRRLRNDLQDIPDLNPMISTTETSVDEKGVISDVGKIIVSYIKEDAISFIVDTLSAYFKRDSTLTLELQKEGKTVKFSAKNMDSEQLDKTRSLIKEIFM